MPAVIGWCSPITALPHACLPVRWWIRFAAAKPRWLKQPTGLFLRATFRIHNHLPPKQKKDIPFGMSFCFGGRWWIRTTEVIDDRFTVCSLWPLGKPSVFSYQLDWSWWTDLNPRPADYKSAALPTELHQRFCQAVLSWRLVYNTTANMDCQQLFTKISKIFRKNTAGRFTEENPPANS